ncbi:hypothetical protein PanWU01x14_320050 [Parasponia andersonii]|uniref:Reverse transcriptase zinc-binding domain-containing protein n=1 Tax=Parasponia andersonii TaxID=3476 RepID=A0A2P5ALQ9_PARAD|nr:hypothetical protein PanWU01x14_320050 [Parasponia andersonii]
MQDFLWEGGDQLGGEHLVYWDVVRRPKIQRGLGIGKIRDINEALLMKWLRRFPNETSSLWHKVIKSKYGLSSNQWDAGVVGRVTFRSPWKAISALYGRGSGIRFWKDVWVGDSTLEEDFRSLYGLSSLK